MILEDLMSDNASKSLINCSVPLDEQGIFYGDLMLSYSDNHLPMGYYPVPIAVINNGKGATALLIGGVHGDEFEGPTALMRLVHRIDAAAINGRVIVLPYLNKPAVDASSRVSPLDGVNLNRTFPGHPRGSPSQMLADYIERELMPQSDLVIDLHAGGKASIFEACTLVSRTEDQTLFNANMTLAKTFGLPLVWLLGDYNDDRSVNSAALRTQTPTIAVELGGGGGNDPVHIDIAERGIRRCLKGYGIFRAGAQKSTSLFPRIIEIHSRSQNLYAPVSGLFERRFSAGQDVNKGQFAGCLYPSDQPWAAPVVLEFPESGLVLAHGNRGNVTRGDMLAMVAHDTSAI